MIVQSQTPKSKMNNPLISEIYELRKDNYKDIRHLYTENAMTKRLDTIKQLISKIPPSQRVSSNLKYKKLHLESRMILWKKAVYTTKDQCMTFTRFQMELTDKRSYDRGVVESTQETTDIALITLGVR